MNPLIQTYSLQPVHVLELIVVLLFGFACLLLYQNQRFRGLCLLLALDALLMGFNFSEETGFFNQTYLITPVFTLATGPAFYLFVRHLVDAKHQWRRHQFWHAAPALIALPFTHFSAAVIAVGSLSLVCYGWLALRLLRRYHHESYQWTSAAVDMQLTWLTRLVILFAVLGITDLIRLNLQPVLSYELMNTWYFVHQLCVSLLFGSLIYYAIRQPALFDHYGEAELASTRSDTIAIEHSLFEAIDQCVQSQQLYCQPRLSLDDVAKATGLGIKDVSNAINTVSKQSFCHYINALRINAVKQALRSHSNRNVLQTALDFGFNSKSSFNTLFKQSTGLTPSAYIKQQRSES